MKIIKTDELERAKMRKSRSLARNQKPNKVVKTKTSEKRKRKQCKTVGYVSSMLTNISHEQIFYAGMPDPRQRKRKAGKTRSKQRISYGIRMEKL